MKKDSFKELKSCICYNGISVTLGSVVAAFNCCCSPLGTIGMEVMVLSLRKNALVMCGFAILILASFTASLFLFL